MTSVNHLFVFSGHEYEPKAFLEKLKTSFPLIALTVSGYAGVDGINEVSSDELYWVFGIQKQRRMVARDQYDRYISIPVDYRVKFQKTRGPDRIARPLAQLIEYLDGNETFMVENDGSVNVNLGADQGTNIKFGPLRIIDEYEEKYILGHSIFSNQLYAIATGIPVYLPITLDVAIGFKYGSLDLFRKWLIDITQLGQRYTSKSIEPCNEIILFPEKPSGDYEYLDVTKYISGTAEQIPFVIESDEATIKKSASKSTNNKYREKPQVNFPIPPIPLKPEPVKPAIPKNDDPPPVVYVGNDPPPKLPPPRRGSLRHQSNQPSSTFRFQRSQSEDKATSLNKKQPVFPPENTENGQTKGIYEEPKGIPEEERPKLKPLSCNHITRFSSIGEVPEDLNDLTVDEVAHVIELLGIAELAELFHHKLVDGRLFSKLDEKTLVQSFKLTMFDANQIKAFIDGWRPKQST